MSEAERPLPEVVELAWGLRQDSRRGPRPSLTTAQIIETAVAIADSDGLAKVSMQSVAEPLGVAPTALYRYVGSKETLIGLCTDAAIGPPPKQIRAAEGWRAKVRGWSDATAELYRRHPWLLDVPVTGMPAMPNNLMWLEVLLDALADAPLDPSERSAVILLVQGHVHNASVLARSIGGMRVDPDEAGYAEIIARVAPAEQFPAVSAMLREEPEADTAAGPEYGLGLDIILDGIQARQPSA
jgi:AcrR family transcriptional regulator